MPVEIAKSRGYSTQIMFRLGTCAAQHDADGKRQRISLSLTATAQQQSTRIKVRTKPRDENAAHIVDVLRIDHTSNCKQCYGPSL